jgi:predicted PurR-regulated permease PerM
MSVTIDIKVVAYVVIAIMLVILIAYLIKLARKLIITLNHTNKILEDVEVISEIASDRSKDVDEIISGITESVASVSDALKGNQNLISAAAAVGKAVVAVKKYTDKDESKK